MVEQAERSENTLRASCLSGDTNSFGPYFFFSGRHAGTTWYTVGPNLATVPGRKYACSDRAGPSDGHHYPPAGRGTANMASNSSP